jgi:hypothetical protein
VALGLGLVPGLGTGIEADALLQPPHFLGILASGTYWLASSADAGRGAHADVSLAYGGLALCPRWSSGRYHLRACAGMLAGALDSRGVGFDTTSATEKLFLGVDAEARFAARIVGPLVFSAGLGVVVPIVRSQLLYTAADGTEQELFRASQLAGVGEIGLGVTFP